MNTYALAQISGAAIMVLGIQGGIRLLAHASDAGLLSWLPGDVSLKIAAYVAIAVAGGILVSWAHKNSPKK